MSAAGSSRYPGAARQVGAGDIGSRVSIRREVTGGYRDTVGILEGYDGEYADVRRPDGELRRIVLDAVVASRVVRPR